MGNYFDDYNAMRPGTVGGENAKNDFMRSIAPTSYPTPGPDIPDVPEAQPIRPPKAKRVMTKRDLVISAIVFFVAWPMLAASSSMDVGTAAVFAFFASAIAGLWWRQVIVIAILGIAILIFAYMK